MPPKLFIALQATSCNMPAFHLQCTGRLADILVINLVGPIPQINTGFGKTFSPSDILDWVSQLKAKENKFLGNMVKLNALELT